MGGTINIESEEEKGTVVVVRIPPAERVGMRGTCGRSPIWCLDKVYTLLYFRIRIWR